MISNSDFEKAWFLYKTEYEPQNISINDFCFVSGHFRPYCVPNI